MRLGYRDMPQFTAATSLPISAVSATSKVCQRAPPHALATDRASSDSPTPVERYRTPRLKRTVILCISNLSRRTTDLGAEIGIASRTGWYHRNHPLAQLPVARRKRGGRAAWATAGLVPVGDSSTPSPTAAGSRWATPQPAWTGRRP